MNDQISREMRGLHRLGTNAREAGHIRPVDVVERIVDDEARARSAEFVESVIGAFERIRRRRRY